MNEAALLSLLYSAMEAEYGVLVETEDPERLRQKLYPLRKQHEVFGPLAFIIIGPDLWIAKQGEN